MPSLPNPSFKVRRLSMVNENDEIRLRKINLFLADRDKGNTIILLANKKTYNFGVKIRLNPDASYLKFYRQHNAWLNKVIYDIEAGRKVAFGAFRNYTKQHTLFAGVDVQECLIGSIIIKKGHSGQIELKNLLTDHFEIKKCFEDVMSTEQINKTKNDIRQSLIDRCENFCSFRNYRRIEIEISSTNYDTINLFLKNEYRIIHTRRSKYKESDYFYVFSKNLSNFQGNDPYDYQFLIKNILSYYLPFQILKLPNRVASGFDEDINTIYYSIKSAADADPQLLGNNLDVDDKDDDNDFLDSPFVYISDDQDKTDNRNLGITVECKVDFDLTKEDDNGNKVVVVDNEFSNKFDSASHLKILFTDKKVLIDDAGSKGLQNSIKILEWKDFENLENVKKLYLTKLLKKNEIEGFLLVVEEKVKNRIIEFSQKEGLYDIHLFDGCGSYLKNADNIKFHKTLKIFFYTHSSFDHPEEGIWGYADLVNHAGGAQNFFDGEDEIRSDSTPSNSTSIYDESDLDYFSFYNDERDKNVIIFKIQGIRVMTRPIPLNEKILSRKMTDYVYNREGGEKQNQWFDTFWFNSYLDHETVTNIFSLDVANVKKQVPKSLIQTKPNKDLDMENDDILLKVVILTAIQEEYEAVRKHLSNVKPVTKLGTRYEEGIFVFGGKRIAKIIIREGGATNLVAAVETERAIQSFSPECMLFVGIAGSRKPKDFVIGDVLFAEKIYSYEGGKDELDSFSARPDSANLSYNLFELAKEERRKKDWKQLIKGRIGSKSSIKANLGIIASGEKLIEHYSSHIGKILSKHYNDTSAVEMEGMGFAKTASSRQENYIHVAVIRGISDILEQDDSDNLNQIIDKRPKGNKDLASNTAAAFAFWLIAKFVESRSQE